MIFVLSFYTSVEMSGKIFLPPKKRLPGFLGSHYYQRQTVRATTVDGELILATRLVILFGTVYNATQRAGHTARLFVCLFVFYGFPGLQ